ncbi:MAG: redoxin domain-containing protein [Flavobacteriaceae bacterium]|nr:redoxin domain-containing protein [Flavobacteriaceae bacterium]
MKTKFMKIKYYLFIIVLFSLVNISFGQKQFPIKSTLRDLDNKKVQSNAVIYNNNKPIIIVIWASFIKSNIDLLNSFKEVYPEWQKTYGVKIIAISMEKRYRKKDALAQIKENKWPFNFYFDYEQMYFIRSSPSRAVPQVLIYDKNYNLIERFNHTVSNYDYDNQDVINMPNKVKRINLTNEFSNLDCDLTLYKDVLDSIK